jgi:hypothetical protein
MRRLLAITLTSLTAFGGVAYATSVIRAHAGPRFTVSVSPGHQSAVRGGTARFGVDIVRAKGFTGVVTLNSSDLPRGVSATWELADGRRSAVVARGERGAVLILRTTSQTPMGTRRVKVLATGGGTARAIPLALTLMPNSLRRFSLSVTPARQTVPAGATATYRIHIARAAHFHRPVAKRILRLPRGMKATWTTNAVAIKTNADEDPGSVRLVVEGTSWVGGRAVRRDAIVVLSTVESRPFEIRGDLAQRLYPGTGAPLDLVLTNPNRFDLRVAALSVSIGAGTSRGRCSGDANYTVRQYRGTYPLLLAPGATRLSALVANTSLLPRIAMHDLSTNQDGCRGAVVSLKYRGAATR